MKTHLDRLVLIAALALAPGYAEAGIKMPKEIKKPAAEASENYNSKKEDKVANIYENLLKNDDFQKLAYTERFGSGLNDEEKKVLEAFEKGYMAYRINEVEDEFFKKFEGTNLPNADEEKLKSRELFVKGFKEKYIFLKTGAAMQEWRDLLKEELRIRLQKTDGMIDDMQNDAENSYENIKNGVNEIKRQGMIENMYNAIIQRIRRLVEK